MTSRRISVKASLFGESVIREMTRLAAKHDAINLSQGYPDFPAPSVIKEAACKAILDDINQYAITWGAQSLREAIARKYRDTYEWEVDPEREVTVVCGATEGMIAAVLGLVDPGERVLVIEPFYENYSPDAIISGASPVIVKLDPNQDWKLDLDRLRQQISDLESPPKALILNSPHNPTGKVFSQEELAQIALLSDQYGFMVITDEIYEYILYSGQQHSPIALFPGMKDRTVTISGLSKTFSVTGWRLGYVIAPADLTNAIRKVHDFLTVGAAAPLQEAAVAALDLPSDYYRQLAKDYQEKRDFLLDCLTKIGFRTWTPQGAYYIMADIRSLTTLTDVEFVQKMIRDQRVAAVPGSSFFHQPEEGSHLVRFAFCKSMETLRVAAKRLQGLLKD